MAVRDFEDAYPEWKIVHQATNPSAVTMRRS